MGEIGLFTERDSEYFAAMPREGSKHFFGGLTGTEYCDSCGAPATTWLCTETRGESHALLPLCEAHRAVWRADLERATEDLPFPVGAAYFGDQMQHYLDRLASGEAVRRTLCQRMIAQYAARHPGGQRDLKYEASLLHRLSRQQRAADGFRSGAPLGKE